ncbi:MAG: hypothetical protein JST59_10580 [Actinobacteria bacterium]|nr:hypothetical protein [Actinomycetota bacterium]
MRSLRRRLLPAVLLLLLVLPTAAHAQNPGEVIYHQTVPTIESEPAPPVPQEPGPKKPKPGHQSKAGPESRPPIEPEADERVAEPDPTPRLAPESKKRPHPHAPNHASRDEGTRTPVASHQETPASTEAEVPKKAGGGSSPVVPLLIAVSVLAVISIGVARHRLNR